MSLTRATLASDNTVYAQLTLDVGPRYVWQMAHRLGVHISPDKPVASIGLGSLAVSPLDMAAAYATFAAMGIYAKPMAITKVILPGQQGRRRTAAGASRRRSARLSEGVAWKVNDVLRQNALYGTGAGSGDGIAPNAGKTGTTENHADAWFDGYTRQLSTVVWMGYPKGEIPMLNVHGQAGRRRDVPGPDLARVHGGCALAPQGARIRAAEPLSGVALDHPWQLRELRLHADLYADVHPDHRDDHDDDVPAARCDDARSPAARPHDACEDDHGSGTATAARHDHAAAATGDAARSAAGLEAGVELRVRFTSGLSAQTRGASSSAQRAPSARRLARSRKTWLPVAAMRVRSSSSAASCVIACASASGSSGGTSSADSPSASSSRAATVSAVITGAPVESASKTVGGIARDSRKLPSTTPA